MSSVPYSRKFPGGAVPIALLLMIASLFAARRAIGADEAPALVPPPRLDIRLRNVRWQALPREVETVYAGPDKRVWYELAGPGSPKDVDDLRQRVEREFNQPAPQLQGVYPALFEPGGRVWFTIRGFTWYAPEKPLAGQLFGYDGKTWIVRNQACGDCPNHDPSCPSGPYCDNLFLDGAAFFPAQAEIDCFDGKDWSVQPLAQSLQGLLVEGEFDGKGVTAFQFVSLSQGQMHPHGGSGGGQKRDDPSLWRWRNGKWAQVSAPRNFHDMLRFAPVRDGIWMLSYPIEPKLQFHPYDPTSPAPVRALLPQLSEPDPAKAERAAAELEGLGPWVVPHVKTALADTGGLPVAQRLKSVLADFAKADKIERRRRLDYRDHTPAADWVAKLADPAPAVQEEAGDRLWRLGTEAVPFLTQELSAGRGRREPAVAERIRQVLADIDETDRQVHPRFDEEAAGRWIAQLNDPNAGAAAHEKAAAGLRAMGPAVRIAVEIAINQAKLGGHDNAEQVRRLERVYADIWQAEQMELTDASPFGPCRLKHCKLLLHLPGNRVCVSAENVLDRGVNLGPGLVVLDVEKNTYRAIASKELFGALDYRLDSPPIRRPQFVGDNRAWFPDPYHRAAACLVDLESWKVLDRLPDARFDTLHAALPDGRVFASFNSGFAQSTVMLFTPGAPDEGGVLKAESAGAGRWYAGVASDGSVWAVDPEQGLLRFDGNAWKPMNALKGALRDLKPRRESHEPEPVWGIAGRGGRMLVKAGNTYALWSNGVKGDESDDPVEGQGLERMIQVDRARFIEAFTVGPGEDPDTDRWWRHSAVVADKGANIWALGEDGYNRIELSVLIGQDWHTPHEEPFRIGVCHLGPVGDGSKVYLTDFDWADSRLNSMEGRTAIGEVRGGKVTFSAAPSVEDPGMMHPPVRDASGGLWVPFGTREPKDPNKAAAKSVFPERLTEAGAADGVEGEGWPVLADASGNLWFAGAGARADGPANDSAADDASKAAARRNFGRIDWLTVRRDGKTVCRLPLVGGSETTFFFSDAPGSVYAFTEAGLSHFVAEDPAQPGQFRFDQTYRIEGIAGGVKHATYSRLGYLVVTTGPDPYTEPDRMYLVPLPTEPLRGTGR